MNCRISYTQAFVRSLKRLSKHYRSMKEDYARLLADLHENPFMGADLGNGLRKVRMAIASKGKGKSAGARVITYKVSEENDEIEIRLLTIYDKSEQASISDKELKQILQEEFGL